MPESLLPGHKKIPTREAIIGLGENSARKNYYSELQEKIQDLEKLLIQNRALIAASPDIIMVGDMDGNVRQLRSMYQNVNERGEKLIADGDVIRIIKDGISEVFRDRQLKTRDFVFKDGDVICHYEARIYISELNEILLTIRDMTDRVELENNLRFMAERDNLTELYNWRFFESYFEQFNNTIEPGVAILIFDIDGLKTVNDTLGHQFGDDIIMTASALLYGQFGDQGILARIGGDEFGVILRGVDSNGVEAHLDQLGRSIEEYNARPGTIRISISDGYAISGREKIDGSTMYSEADNNMYQNKLLKESSVKNNLVKTLMKALEVRDYVTEGHVRRMEGVAKIFAESMRLNQKQMDRLLLLVKFHDIGKVGIPDSILNKRGMLDAEEMKIMKTHSMIGSRIASESTELRSIADLILRHHERWDGTGYPLELSGEDIPIECRILAIVDSYDAMSNDRPYRNAMAQEAVFAEITGGTGTQYDPVLVALFIVNFEKIKLLETSA